MSAAVADGTVTAGEQCTVRDLRMRWEFGQKSWRATFVAGKLAGQTFTSAVANMNEDKWKSLGSAVAGTCAQANFSALKEATRLFLEAHCASQLQEHEPPAGPPDSPQSGLS